MWYEAQYGWKRPTTFEQIDVQNQGTVLMYRAPVRAAADFSAALRATI
jgi:hypothetical protein